MLKNIATVLFSFLYFTLTLHGQTKQTTFLNPVLQYLDGTAAFEIWHYNGAQLQCKETIPIQKTSGVLKTGGNIWKCTITDLRAMNDGAVKFAVNFKLEKGAVSSAAVAVSFNFKEWSTKNYVMIPAAVYNGNRFPVLYGGYMPPYTEEMYCNKNLTLHFSDNPRLALEPLRSSRIELRTWNAATPAMTFFSAQNKKGCMVLMEPQTKLGISGMYVEENMDRSRAVFSVTAPGVRSKIADFGGFKPSDDKAADWKAGDEVTLQLYFYVFKANDLPAFLDVFMNKRKALSGETPQYYVAPMSAIFDYTRQQVETNRFHNSSFASIYFPENSLTRFQLGWIGGMMNTYPMLLLNDSVQAGRVANTMDFVVDKMQGKSGFFYGVIDNGTTLVSERPLPQPLQMKYPQIISSAMVRKNADALFWFCKHFMLYKALNRSSEIKPSWEAAAKRLAWAFVTAWKKNRDLGQYLDPESGEIIVYNSTAASIAPAALVLAAKYFNEPEFLECAKEAAASYYHRFTETLGLTGGNCGDISQDADSESAFGLLESFMALYWATGDRQWLAKGKAEAALGSTWTISYNYEFPTGSDLHTFHAHTTGGVWASTQNKHAAPGICTSSGDYLFKLYRATGEKKYARLLRDILNGHTEEVELPGRPTVSVAVKDDTRGSKWGCSMERIQISDAEGKDAIGKLYNGSNGWTELNGMLMSMELPGIYVQTDGNEMFVFDQVKVKKRKDNRGLTVLSIRNPTAYDATVSIFSETSKEAKEPLGYTDFLKWKKLTVKAGKEVQQVLWR